MITVIQRKDNKLSLRAHYNYGQRIKKLPGAFFEYASKTWVVDRSLLPQIENDFKGELVYKTPRWVLFNEPMPDMSKMYKISDSSIKTPEMKCNLYNYQDYGVRFLIERLNKYGFSILADSVGLGKTAQAIAVMKWYIENEDVRKIIVLSKKTIKSQWAEEIEKFTELNNDFYIGYTKTTPKQRREAYQRFQEAKKGILITNYHSFLNDMDILQTLDMDFSIIDEVHEIKSRTGKMNNNIASVLRNKKILFLTGTPIMSKPEDIFGIVQIADPDYFGEWSDFEEQFLVYGDTPYGRQVIGARNLDVLRDMVQNILIRRTEFEVKMELPDTIIKEIRVDMDETQEELLKRIKEEQDKIEQEIKEVGKKDVLSEKEKQLKIFGLESKSKGYIAARQAACTDPRLFANSKSKTFTTIGKALVPKTYKSSAKTDSVMDLLEDIIDNGDKVIMFSKFKTAVELYKKDIEKKFKIPVLTYTGDENDEKRDIAKHLFRDTDEYNIIIGTEALSTGLNLQVARYIINIDQPDTAAIKTQRIGRARRIGSEFKNIIVYDMITRSGAERSKDEERLDNIRNNQDVTDALVSIDDSQRIALIEAMKQ